MKVKKLLIIHIIILSMLIIGCSSHTNTQHPTLIVQKKKQLLIDLDKELSKETSTDELRGGKTLPLELPMYIGDNDEVVIKGSFLIKESPIYIKIGDNDEVSFKSNNYVITTAQLNNGDIILLSDKNQKLFLELEVIR